MIRKGYVDVLPHGQIHYRRADPQSGASPKGRVILLHQRPSSSRMWEPVLPLFAQNGCLAIALDLPGHGESLRPQEYTLSTFARYVSQAMAHLNSPADQPTIIVGHHIGAGVAMQLAVDFPEMVDKLALWGVPILDEEVKKLAPPPPNLEDDDLQDVMRFWKIRGKFTGRPGYQMPAATRVARLVELLQTDEKVSELFDDDVESLVKRITQPTLCMYGDNEILKAPTIRIADELKDGKLFCIPNAGIDVQDEYPEEFTNAVVEFLLE